MGRAIVRSPQVFLMDEPLSNLDAKLRVQTRTQIASLQRRLGVTTVYVTHDQIEAMTMGDRIALLKDGILQQCATPREMYDRPNNVFVAGFIGSPAMNLVSVPVNEDGVQFGSHRLPVERDILGAAGNQVIVGMRPEDVEVTTNEDGLELIVDVVEELGADAYVYATPADTTSASRAPATTPWPSRSSPASTAARSPRRARRSSSTPTPSTCTCSTRSRAPGWADRPPPRDRRRPGRALVRGVAVSHLARGATASRIPSRMPSARHPS